MGSRRILVVEDEGVSAMELNATLCELGYEVLDIVKSGEEAVRRAGELLPDLILMDITLDGPMSGIEAAAEINKSHLIPIIYLTSHDDNDTLDQAKITEPVAYLLKPCRKNILAATIAVALYKSEADAGRRKAEAALKQLLNEQKIILENIGVGVLFLKNRQIFWANSAIVKIFGYSLDELQGQETALLYPDRETYLAVGEKAYAALGRGEVFSCHTPMLKNDGAELWGSLVGQAINPACLAEGTIWIVEDVTGYRRIMAALLEREEKYRTVADFTHDWEFWIGVDDSLLYCSPSCERVSGRSATEFEQNPALLRQIVHPDDLALYDGHRHDAKEGRQPAGLEYRIVRADGTIRWVSHVCQPVFDLNGQFTGIRGSNRDITARKAMEAEVAKGRNLAALGVLAGGIAHDFNNLLQGLLGNISLAQMSTPESSEAYQYLHNAEQAYRQASKLTGQLIAFSSGGFPSLIDLYPADFLREAISTEVGGHNVVLEFDIAEDLGPLMADPLQLRQVLHHLTINAIEAMPSGGKLLVRAIREELSPASAKVIRLSPGPYLKISLQDQGSGINAEVLPRIFDPYFSTKERGVQKGMGLGLALCNTIIQKHGGALTVDTAVGEGSTFYIHLPITTSAVTQKAATKAGEGQGSRLLIMDDDLAVLSVTSQFLGRHGYRVDSAKDGMAAIKAYQEALAGADPYAIVILDLIIPGGIGGKEVIAILKEIEPTVKAIVSSGFIDDPIMTNFVEYGFVAAFEKPYPLRELKALLGRLL